MKVGFPGGSMKFTRLTATFHDRPICWRQWCDYDPEDSSTGHLHEADALDCAAQEALAG